MRARGVVRTVGCLDDGVRFVDRTLCRPPRRRCRELHPTLYGALRRRHFSHTVQLIYSEAGPLRYIEVDAICIVNLRIYTDHHLHTLS